MDAQVQFEALEARYAEAHTLGQAVEPTLLLVRSKFNEAIGRPDPTAYVLNLYDAVPEGRRLTMGSPAEDERRGQVRCRVYAPLYAEDEKKVWEIVDAIAPAFLSGKHPQLRFDEAPRVVAFGNEDEFFRIDVVFEYQFDVTVTTAA